MAVVESSVELDASIEEVFEFISNPKNIESVYPKDMRFKVLEMPERIYNGAVVTMSALLMGQVFTWNTVIKDLNRPYGFVDEALDSPFRYWRHRHMLSSMDGKCIMKDRIEFSTALGFLGDRFAERMISNILEYRNTLISKIFNKSNDVVYAEERYNRKDPTKISIAKGTALSLLMIAVAVALPLILKGSLLVEVIVGLTSWLLLWFFTHDIAHLAIGRLLGIRFSYYYIGISNLTKTLPLKPKYKLLFIALGIKIDRSNSKASKRAYAAMYLAGPIATMLSPFYIPTIYLTYSMEAALFLLIISIINLVSDVVLSSKHGCIRKGVRALSKHS